MVRDDVVRDSDSGRDGDSVVGDDVARYGDSVNGSDSVIGDNVVGVMIHRL